MDILVTCERRMVRTPDGQLWSPSIDDYRFWTRYLDVFDSVTVLSRVEDAERAPGRAKPVTGPGVRVCPLPDFATPTRLARHGWRVLGACRAALPPGGAAMLRAPGTVAVALFSALGPSRRPFGIEVVGDPRGVFSRESFPHPLGPVYRAVFTNVMALQCGRAAAAAYVTETSLQERYPPSPGAFSTHYSSVSLPPEAFADHPRTAPVSGRPLTLASVGSMARTHKGFDILIDGAMELERRGWPFRLLLIGGGAHLENLRQRALPLGDRVEFTGELDGPEKVREALREADLLVHPSLSEGLPRVVIEAMALGMPCIATHVGGTAELLDPGDIIRPGDRASLVQAIEGYLKEPVRMEVASRRNLSRAADFREDVLTGRRRRMYQALKTRTEDWFRDGGR